MDSKFSAEDFYHPDRFVTVMDTVARGMEQFKKGMDVGKQSVEIHISVNDVWGATTKPAFGSEMHGNIQSYEKIGYHANTCDLLKGFIASGCKLLVYRYTDGKVTTTEIK